MSIELTPAQRRAVETEARDCLVIAGAGSGKTRVLTERVRFLIERSGVSPANIMVLTFTRKAAGELLHRLEESIGSGFNPRRAGMLVGTFHSVALTILRPEGRALGLLPDTLTILDPTDANMMFEWAARDLGYLNSGSKWAAGMSKERARQYRDAQYTGRDLDWLETIRGGEAPYARLFAHYRHSLLTMNLLDFGLILRECNRLFDEHPDVLLRYQQRVHHVLVDELQDSDLTQYNLHDRFSPPATFFGVGDTRQAIYGFRGAQPALMLERHPDAKIVNLTDCFRCGASIVKAANRLIAVNAEPRTEPLACATNRDGSVRVEHGRSEFIAQQLVAKAAAGFAWHDIAVLYRAHATGRRLESVCRERSIPVHRVGASFDVCETPEFRLLHRLLRLICNPRDDVAFLATHELLGIDAEALREIRIKAKTGGVGLWQEAYCSPSIRRTAVGVEVKSAMVEEAQNLPAIRTLLNLQACPPLASDALAAAFEFWRRHEAGLSLADLLRWFALRDSQDDLVRGWSGVVLSTVHAAKGLEWPCVFVVNLLEGDFPSGQSLHGDGVRDERRLAYVAFTRAKEALLLHTREPADQDPHRRVKLPSRFIGEAGL